MAIAIRTWFANNTAKYFAVILWTSLNILLFWHTYTHYKYEPSYFYLHQMLGAGLCISRGTASVLNLNCCLLLVPMCRAVMTAIRIKGRGLSRRTVRLLIDHCKGFHISCAYMVFIASVIHYSAHMINARNFSRFYNAVYRDVNAAHDPEQNPLVVVLGSVPGVTGMLMMLILILIAASSTSYMRLGNYDLFWYTHRLYLVFYLLLLTHALRGVLKQQTNLHQHWPGCNYHNLSIPWPESEPEPEYYSRVKEVPCHVQPKFMTLGSSTWMWVIGPIGIYLLDTIYRKFKRKDDAQVVSVMQHPCDVIEINLSKEGFHCKPGQYILINSPKISRFEWHPYSITRVPSQKKPTFTIHVKSTGDWSGRLRNYLLQKDETRRRTPWSPGVIVSEKLLVDGPFGSPSGDILNYSVTVCIAGGIGVTPFIGYLDWLRVNEGEGLLERIYFIWIVRDASALTCFADTICALYTKLWHYNKPDCFVIQLYVTGRDVDNQKQYIDRLHYNYPILSSRVTMGRPKLKTILREISQASFRGKIGVFCCGPKELSRSVEKACYRCNKGRSVFIYNHESF